jgi:hypothetical protein
METQEIHTWWETCSESGQLEDRRFRIRWKNTTKMGLKRNMMYPITTQLSLAFWYNSYVELCILLPDLSSSSSSSRNLWRKSTACSASCLFSGTRAKSYKVLYRQECHKLNRHGFFWHMLHVRVHRPADMTDRLGSTSGYISSTL